MLAFYILYTLLKSPLWYIFNHINKQAAARLIHTTAKSTAIVVDEIAQSARIRVSNSIVIYDGSMSVSYTSYM